MTTATAQASPNIASIKYWGNRDNVLRLPMNGSISTNLDGLYTRTTVSFQPPLPYDELIINGHEIAGPGCERVSHTLDLIRDMANIHDSAEVMTENNFPSGAGIASSASAFAALALAGSKAAGLDLSEKDLSRLARCASGSAARSIPGGFVECQAGESEEDCFAFSIAEPDHWKLVDCVAIVSTAHKKTGSTEGHSIAPTSPMRLHSHRYRMPQEQETHLTACEQHLRSASPVWVLEGYAHILVNQDWPSGPKQAKPMAASLPNSCSCCLKDSMTHCIVSRGVVVSKDASA